MDKLVEEWLSYVHNLPYFERRLEIALKKKPRWNRFLYKYKSIDDEQSVDRVRDILVRSRLWLSSPVDFNDPFDMSAATVVNANARERRERFNTLLKELGVPYKEREQKVKALVRKPIDELKKEFEASYQENIKKVGVFSFAGDPKNILMWSHYAQNHTGICIQFELARDFLTLSSAAPVTYSSDYPEVTWINSFPESIGKAVMQKHLGWSYENEHRIVRPREAHKYLPIDPQAIVGIIMGCRTSSACRKTIEKILEERHCAKMPPVQLFFAQKHGSRYQLSVFRESFPNQPLNTEPPKRTG